MHKCAFCGQEFLYSDEYNTHVMKHYMEKIDNATSLASALMQTDVSAKLADIICQKVIEHLNKIIPPVNSVAVTTPTRPKYSFETLQIANLYLGGHNLNPTVHELFTLLDTIESRLRQ